MKRILHIIEFILLKLLKGISYIILHILKRVLYIVTNILIGLICDIIFIVTYEPFTWKKATVRKAKRIKALTKLKLYAWKYCEPYFRFIDDYKYLEKLYKKFSFLIEEKK